MNNNDSEINKSVAFIFSILAFIEVGLIIVNCQLVFVPEMNFSENGIVRLIGLLLCYIVASKFYNYLTHNNNEKTKAMIIFTIIFISTILISFIIF